MEAPDLGQLLQNLIDWFNESELRTLCLNLGVDYDSLPAQGKAGKARELVAYMDRRDRLDDLERLAQELHDRLGKFGGRVEPPPTLTRWNIVFALALLVVVVAVAIYLLGFFLPTSRFNYTVHVQDKITGLDVPNAQVTIRLGEGETPLEGVTDDHGYAGFAIDARHKGQPATIAVQAIGYNQSTQTVALVTDNLPLPVLLEPVP